MAVPPETISVKKYKIYSGSGIVLKWGKYNFNVPNESLQISAANVYNCFPKIAIDNIA